MPELSIIIVSYNNAQLLEDCIASIKASMPIGTAPEVIVVDNNSADNTVAMLQNKFPEVKLILNKDNKGFAAANNQGIRIAQGEYVMLLNNDTVIINDALSKMITYLREHPKIGLLGPRLLNGDRSVQAQGSMLGPHFWNSKIPVETKFLRGAVFLTSKKVLDQVGLLDENFFFYNEDIDFCWRINKAGLKVVYYPLAEVIHFGGKTDWRRQWLGLKSTLYLWQKYLLKRNTRIQEYRNI
ncbi:MAG: glycosyltransferase family 2 protein [Candidatus Margulisiibacteriota bacterium]|jgi:hypothetical protein